jgi:hypothetical protein
MNNVSKPLIHNYRDDVLLFAKTSTGLHKCEGVAFGATKCYYLIIFIVYRHVRCSFSLSRQKLKIREILKMHIPV